MEIYAFSFYLLKRYIRWRSRVDNGNQSWENTIELTSTTSSLTSVSAAYTAEMKDIRDQDLKVLQEEITLHWKEAALNEHL